MGSKRRSSLSIRGTPLPGSTALRGPRSFDALVEVIVEISERLRFEAAKAVDLRLTLRNWLIGCYIREYEQRGSDRAKYGANLLDALSAKLSAAKVEGVAVRSLRLYRQFYSAYPDIWQTLSAEFRANKLPGSIWQTLSAKSPAAEPAAAAPSRRLLEALSFSHFAELIQFDDPLQRAFYEAECLRGRWSVRGLKRQIASLYYERSGLSKKEEIRRFLEEQIKSAAAKEPMHGG